MVIFDRSEVKWRNLLFFFVLRVFDSYASRH